MPDALPHYRESAVPLMMSTPHISMFMAARWMDAMAWAGQINGVLLTLQGDDNILIQAMAGHLMHAGMVCTHQSTLKMEKLVTYANWIGRLEDVVDWREFGLGTGTATAL